MKSFVSHFMKNEAGAAAIEYGVIAGLVSVVIVGALMLMAPQLHSLFGSIRDAVIAALTG